jgi:hypothetical protein
MIEVCRHCHQRVETVWEFCAHCGKPVERAVAEPHEPEKAPVTGAFGGLGMGLVLAPVLVIVGAMLCLTGLGAFLGVPMIVAGILSPLAGPVFGMNKAGSGIKH